MYEEEKMSKFRIVDLFSGAGGLTFGFYYNLVNGEFVKRDNVASKFNFHTGQNFFLLFLS